MESPDLDPLTIKNDPDPLDTGVTDLGNSGGVKVARHLRAGRRAETVRQLQKENISTWFVDQCGKFYIICLKLGKT
jgi:hypothetical protein